MQKLSHRFLTALQARRPVVAIVRDCSRLQIPLFLLWACLRLVWTLVAQRARVQAVHFADPVVALLAPVCTLWRIPTLVTVHGLDVTYSNPVYQRLLGLCLRTVGAFVCISLAARDACVRQGFPTDRCRVITPGIERPPDDSVSDSRRLLGERLGFSLNGRMILLSVGRLVRRKGIAWFVESVLPALAERDPSVLLLVAGDGPERERLDTASVGLGEHLCVLGTVTDEMLSLCQSAADVFVMPNVPIGGDMEGFGLVALEAAAAGLPVVASDLEGIRDAVTPGKNGILVTAVNPEAFISTLMSLGQDPIQLRLLGQSACEYTLANHSWDKMADRYCGLYDELAATARLPGLNVPSQHL
jgi:phosphatidyl-myo-inositol dimannoside synthase